MKYVEREMIFLLSNDSLGTHPKNVISDFINDLPSVNIRQEEWLVSLRKFACQRTWLNFTKRGGLPITINITNRNSSIITNIQRVIPPGSYSSPERIIEMLFDMGRYLTGPTNRIANDQADRIKLSTSQRQMLLKTKPEIYDMEQILRIVFDPATRKFRFTLRNDTEMGRQIYRFDIKFGYNKGFHKLLGMVSTRRDRVYKVLVSRRKARTVTQVMPRASTVGRDVDNMFIHMPNLIEEQIVGSKLEPLLAVVPTNRSTTVEGGYYHFIHPQSFVPLKSQDFTTAKVKITDHKKKRIQFDDFSGPCIVGLSLIKNTGNHMNSVIKRPLASDRIVFLTSKPDNMFPNNTSTDFKTDLIEPLLFEQDDWEVAIQDVYYQKKFFPIKNEIIVETYLYFIAEEEQPSFGWKYSQSTRVTKKVQIHFRPLHYNEPEDVLREFNNTGIDIDFSDVLHTPDDTKETTRWIGKVSDFLKLSYSISSRRFRFALNTPDVIRTVRLPIIYSAEIKLHKRTSDEIALTDMLGARFTQGHTTDSKVYQVTLETPMQTFEAPPDFTNGSYNIWIEAPNLVGPCIVGEKTRPLLNMFSMEGKNGEFLHHNFHYDKEYVPVVSSHARDIHIQLKNDLGCIIDFTDVVIATTVILNFRHM
jgi:hypothetical protein